MSAGVAASSLDGGAGYPWQALDAILTRVDMAQRSGGRRVLFVAPEHDCGTTLLAAGTAVALSRDLQRRILLAELNPFTPALQSYLALAGACGWSDVLDGRSALEAALAEPVPGLRALAGGTPRPLRAGEFAGPEARARLQELTHGEHGVILDAPPFLEHPEARVLLEFADAVLIVLRARKSSKARAARLVRLVRESEVPLLGVVLNRFASDLPFGLGAAGQMRAALSTRS